MTERQAFIRLVGAENYRDEVTLAKSIFGATCLCQGINIDDKIVDTRLDLKRLDRDDQRLVKSDLHLLTRLHPLRHRNLVVFLGCDIDHNKISHVYTRHCKGPTLQQLMNHRRSHRNTIVEEKNVSAFLYQMAHAVAFLHDLSIVHRDLRPAAFVLASHNTIVLTDLSAGAQLTLRARSVDDKPHYTAPEIIRNNYFCFDYPCDIWSLGVIAFELHTLRLPFDGQTPSDVATKIRASHIEPLGPSVSEKPRSLLGRMLDPIPPFRPTCKDILSLDFLRVAADQAKTESIDI